MPKLNKLDLQLEWVVYLGFENVIDRYCTVASLIIKKTLCKQRL